MKTTGIVRRIDELGRIVIPKEVRKRLKMDNGDLVDISLADETVVLSKFYPLNQDYNLINAFCHSIKEVFGCDIIITDLECIICNTLDEELNNQALEETFFKRVNAYLDKEISPLHRFVLTQSYTIDREAILYQINLNNNLYGYLFVLDSIISKRQKDTAELILNYLDKIL